MDENKKEIYLAGGCFWGTEHFLKQIEGVISTEVGYANSNKVNPTYKEVCTGTTNATETVKVIYDADQVDLAFILDLFFLTIDPTSVNRQGNDVGTQYRTGIYFVDSSDEAIIRNSLNTLAQKYQKPLAVEVLKLQNFYPAELYHQDYLENNPGGYCHVSKELFELAKNASKKEYRPMSQEELLRRLSPLEYHVTQNNGTEPAFQNKYWNETRKGIYVDITSGEPLFLSTDKFQSECGWPAFSKPIDSTLVKEVMDSTHNMLRVEIRAKNSDSHLGHVFNDGPEELGGLRYCINSASLKFIPLEEMKAKGYGKYIKYLK